MIYEKSEGTLLEKTFLPERRYSFLKEEVICGYDSLIQQANLSLAVMNGLWKPFYDYELEDNNTMCCVRLGHISLLEALLCAQGWASRWRFIEHVSALETLTWVGAVRFSSTGIRKLHWEIPASLGWTPKWSCKCRVWCWDCQLSERGSAGKGKKKE